MRAHTEQQENKILLDSPVGLPQSTSSDVNSVEVALLGISLNRCKPGGISQSDCDRPEREIENEKAHQEEALESMSVSQSGRVRRYKGVGLIAALSVPHPLYAHCPDLACHSRKCIYLATVCSNQ